MSKESGPTESLKIKLTASAIITMFILIAVPISGLTSMEQDDREGLLIDFGYWDVVWIEMTFSDDMDGVDVLYEACHIQDYVDPVFSDDEETILYAVNDQQTLTGFKWGLYVISKDRPRGSSDWEYVEDPHSINVKDYALICWARSESASTVIPGTDSSGFTYYSYGKDGVSIKTGEKLRVVTLAPSLTEMVAAAGGTDLIIGTDVYSDYPSDVVDRQNSGEISFIGGYTDPNYEWIIRLAPDIVFCDGGVGEHVTIANKLRKSGINCIVTYDSASMDTLYNNMWIVASALGYEENANNAINYIRTTVDTIAGILGVQHSKKVFVALSSDPSPWTAGSDTFINDMFTRIYGKNIFSSQQSSWFMVSKESIHFSQPEVIVIIYEGKEITSQEEYESILDRLDPLWKETPAFRNGDIYIFSGKSADILSRPGPRLGMAIELLAKALHPDPFQSKDPLDTIPKFLGDDHESYLIYQRSVF